MWRCRVLRHRLAGTPEGREFLQACRRADLTVAERVAKRLPRSAEVYQALLDAYEQSRDPEGVESVLRRAEVFVPEGSMALRQGVIEDPLACLDSLPTPSAEPDATADDIRATMAAAARNLRRSALQDAAVPDILERYHAAVARGAAARCPLPDRRNLLELLLAKAATIEDITAVYAAQRALNVGSTRDLAAAMQRLRACGYAHTARTLYDREETDRLKQCHVVARAYIEAVLAEHPPQAEVRAVPDVPSWWGPQPMRWRLPRDQHRKCTRAVWMARGSTFRDGSLNPDVEAAYTAYIEATRLVMSGRTLDRHLELLRRALLKEGLDVRCLREGCGPSDSRPQGPSTGTAAV